MIVNFLLFEKIKKNNLIFCLEVVFFLSLLGFFRFLLKT